MEPSGGATSHYHEEATRSSDLIRESGVHTCSGAGAFNTAKLEKTFAKKKETSEEISENFQGEDDTEVFRKVSKNSRGRLGISGGVGPGDEMGAQGDHGPAGPSGPSGRTGKTGNPGDPGPKRPSGPKRARVHVKWTCSWKDVWRIVLYSLWIHGTLGCDVGKVKDCPEFSNFGRSPIPYGGSVEMGRIPYMVPQQHSLKIDIYRPSEKFNCLTIAIASHHNCSVRLWNRPVTDCPGFSLEHVGNESVIKYTNITENLAYCAYVEGPNYHYVYQGDVFIDDIPSAPTCPAPPTAAFVSQSGCEQDPPGHVKPGKVCHFSCPDGYIGHGDEKKTCMADGTWSSTNFTCEAASLNNDNNTGYIVAVSILAIIVVVGFTIIGCCCLKYRKYKKRQQSKKSGLPRVHCENGVNGTLNGDTTIITQIGD